MAVVGLVVVAGFGLQHVYLRGRYTRTGPPLAPWARDVKDQRIAIVGPYAILQYPLYGKNLSNYVQYVGKKGPHGAFDPIRECAAWRRSLNAGRYSYVVTARDTGSVPRIRVDENRRSGNSRRERRLEPPDPH